MNPVNPPNRRQVTVEGRKAWLVPTPYTTTSGRWYWLAFDDYETLNLGVAKMLPEAVAEKLA